MMYQKMDVADPVLPLHNDLSLTLHTFPIQEIFVWRHEQGTSIEMDNEEMVLKRFNDRRHSFKAWPIAPIPGLTTAFTKSWLLLVNVPSLTDKIGFPSLSDRFTIDMAATVEREDGHYSLVHLSSTRIPNPYEDMETIDPPIKKCAAFKVEVPRSWQTDEGAHVELDLLASFQIASAIDDIQNISLSRKSQDIIIQWDTASVTSDAELAALRHFVEESRLEGRRPSPRSTMAFKMIQNFHGAEKIYSNLLKEFPHLENPIDPFHRVPSVLLDKFRAFNKDHREAYRGLSRIPNGLYFVNGCPGAGKTEWNMVVAALIQSKRRQRSKKKHVPILFLVDINKTVDDAADRYFSLCKAAGLKLRIIRMHGWPYEMRNSDKLHHAGRGSEGDSDEAADFTKKFLVTAGLARYMTLQPNPDKAPTLDEAAWEYFQRHKHAQCFAVLAKILERMESGEVLTTGDWKALRNSVAVLYRAVLAQADFIATTPVATYGSFPKLFRPEVIFIDEAPHARELTTLIPIAFFDPVVWIFTGDVNQTQPFVKGGDKRDMERQGLKFNPFANQLRFSTMARAAAVGALNGKLLVNKRAYGNLHRLPSKMFYGSQMVSGHDSRGMYPPSTMHLRSCLEKLAADWRSVGENRVIVQLESSCEQTKRSSFWNPTHHAWVARKVEALLRDRKFQSITRPNTPGTIMIETPYSASVREYDAYVKQLPEEWQNRVQALTVDKAQGNQADVVILDMVRTTTPGFMDNPQRLNVAITRARQAEIIVMHHMMTVRKFRGQKTNTQYTSQLWEDAEAGGRLFYISP